MAERWGGWRVAAGALCGCAALAMAQTQPEDAGSQGEGASSQPVPAEARTEASPGRALFLESKAAIQRAQSIMYRGKTYGTGGMERLQSKTQADVRMLRLPRGAWLVRSVGTGSTQSVPNVEFDVAWLEASNEWVDNSARKVFEKLKSQSKGVAYTIGAQARLDDLTDYNPYKTELVPEAEYEVESPREQGGVMCDVVLVTKGRTSVRWFFGTEDHMPRKRESVLSMSAMTGTIVVELSDVKVDESVPPRLTPELLRVTVPEGYAEDRVAPPPPPPPPPAMPAPTEQPKGETPVQEGEETTPAPRVEPAPPPVVAAPAFSLKTPGGEVVTLDSLRGKVVVLEFGGSWCLPLRDAHPELESLTQQYKDRDVAVYLVNVREKSAANITADLRKAGSTFGLLLDGDATAGEYRIARYPSYVVIDKNGIVTRTEPGFTKTETMEAVGAAVDAALTK